MWCIIKQKYNAVSASFVAAMDAILMIVASQSFTAIANCRQRWLVQTPMTSQIAVAYVTEACLFVSHAAFAGDGVPRAL